MQAAEELISNVMHVNWLTALVEQRDTWLHRRGGRRIVENLEVVELFEHEELVLSTPVTNGQIEDAKSSALTMAIEIDRRAGLRA